MGERSLGGIFCTVCNYIKYSYLFIFALVGLYQIKIFNKSIPKIDPPSKIQKKVNKFKNYSQNSRKTKE